MLSGAAPTARRPRLPETVPRTGSIQRSPATTASAGGPENHARSARAVSPTWGRSWRYCSVSLGIGTNDGRHLPLSAERDGGGKRRTEPAAGGSSPVVQTAIPSSVKPNKSLERGLEHVIRTRESLHVRATLTLWMLGPQSWTDSPPGVRRKLLSGSVREKTASGDYITLPSAESYRWGTRANAGMDHTHQ